MGGCQFAASHGDPYYDGYSDQADITWLCASLMTLHSEAWLMYWASITSKKEIRALEWLPGFPNVH